MHLDPVSVTRALGGQARGSRVQAPGPGHSKHDRSLSILLDPGAPDGFVVESFAGDPWQDCKRYVREQLGLPQTPTRGIGSRSRPMRRPDGESDLFRTGQAMAL